VARIDTPHSTSLKMSSYIKITFDTSQLAQFIVAHQSSRNDEAWINVYELQLWITFDRKWRRGQFGNLCDSCFHLWTVC